MQFVIEPRRGIGPIAFGMGREEVAAAISKIGGGSPVSRSKETDCFFHNAFQVSFGDAGRADFIELASALSAEVVLADYDVFDIPADELLALIQEYDEPDPELSRPPDSYVFSELILTLWGRDRQYDHKGGQGRPMFSAVGVGAPSYLAAIRAIRRRAAERRTKHGT
jgi:hypothetical protein